MKMFSNLNARLKAYREEHMGENGFSLLELVVAVGVLLALSVGGFLAYSGITTNAKQSAVQAAASQVFSAAVAYDADGDDLTTPATAMDEYEASQQDGDKITVTAEGGKGDAIVITVDHDDEGIDSVTRTNVAPVTP